MPFTVRGYDSSNVRAMTVVIEGIVVGYLGIVSLVIWIPFSTSSVSEIVMIFSSQATHSPSQPNRTHRRLYNQGRSSLPASVH